MSLSPDERSGASSAAAIALALAAVGASGIYRPPTRTPAHAARSVALVAAAPRTGDASPSPRAAQATGVPATSIRPAPAGSPPAEGPPSATPAESMAAAPTAVSATAAVTNTPGATSVARVGFGPTVPVAATGAAAAPTPGPALPGTEEIPPPYFSFRRPFGPPLETRASRFYPYGTTGGGEYLLHHGIDLGNPLGTPVLAVGEGEVIYAGADTQTVWGATPDFYGRLVLIRHPEHLDGAPLYSLYGHLSRVKVRARQRVGAGEVIGLVGAEGIALGPHLHLEFRAGGTGYGDTVNPELLLAPSEGEGVILGRLLGPDGSLTPGADLGLYRRGEDGRETWLAQTTSYPPTPVNPSRHWAENFLFADTAAGTYTVAGVVGGLRATAPVTVTNRAVVFVVLQP